MTYYAVEEVDAVLIDPAGRVRISRRKAKALRMMAASLGQSTGTIRDIESYRIAALNVFTSRDRRLIEQRIERYERDGYRSYKTENLVPFLSRLEADRGRTMVYLELVDVLARYRALTRAIGRRVRRPTSR